jgi:hypothetical protein
MSRQPESHELLGESQRWSCATLEAGVQQVANQSQPVLGSHEEEEEAELLQQLKDRFYLSILVSSLLTIYQSISYILGTSRNYIRSKPKPSG